MEHDQNRRNAYLTIVGWPGEHGRELAIRALSEAQVCDTRTLKMRLRQEPPLILGGVTQTQGEQGAAAIGGIGGEAFPCTIADVARLGATLKIKHMEVREGALAVDLWYGLSTTIRFEDIQILVRAQLSGSKERAGNPARFSPYGGGLHDHTIGRMTGMYTGGLSIGMVGAAAYGIDNAMASAVSTDMISTSDKLDIHTAQGDVFQIDGDKFSYQALGKGRGNNDKYNMDRMCELLQHFAPNAVVDEFFSLWKPPVGVDRLRLPDRKKNQDEPAFAFYSRWTALVYRYVLRMV